MYQFHSIKRIHKMANQVRIDFNVRVTDGIKDLRARWRYGRWCRCCYASNGYVEGKMKLQSGWKLVLPTTYTLKFKPHALSFRQDKSVPSKNAWAVVPSLQNAQWCEIISKTSLFLLCRFLCQYKLGFDSATLERNFPQCELQQHLFLIWTPASFGETILSI